MIRPCVECGSIMGRRVSGREVYPTNVDMHAKSFWRCDCGAFVSCHKFTGKPMGAPAGVETRLARRQAHIAFDPLWQTGGMTRAKAYSWLAKKLRIPVEECHISYMGRDQAERVARICWERRCAT